MKGSEEEDISWERGLPARSSPLFIASGTPTFPGNTSRLGFLRAHSKRKRVNLFSFTSPKRKRVNLFGFTSPKRKRVNLFGFTSPKRKRVNLFGFTSPKRKRVNRILSCPRYTSERIGFYTHKFPLIELVYFNIR